MYRTVNLVPAFPCPSVPTNATTVCRTVRTCYNSMSHGTHMLQQYVARYAHATTVCRTVRARRCGFNRTFHYLYSGHRKGSSWTVQMTELEPPPPHSLPPVEFPSVLYQQTQRANPCSWRGCYYQNSRRQNG